MVKDSCERCGVVEDDIITLNEWDDMTLCDECGEILSEEEYEIERNRRLISYLPSDIAFTGEEIREYLDSFDY